MAGHGFFGRGAAAMLLACCACSPGGSSGTASRGSLTTDTDSQSLPDRQQRLAFLERYLRLKSPIADTEFIIRYQDNSGGGIPGPSDWDIRAVLQVESQTSPWHDGWVPCAAEGATGDRAKVDAAWARPLLGRRAHWQTLRSSPRCYRNPGSSASFVLVYEEDKLVLYRSTTTPAAP
ncbi:hypothetical protein [Sorangium sp. So ce861]|uniref:hypothetical protein n=1 Tax=Sorangium sp. So ce861 TaxID=3133323 RepID=UPI003F61B774